MSFMRNISTIPRHPTMNIHKYYMVWNALHCVPYILHFISMNVLFIGAPILSCLLHPLRPFVHMTEHKLTSYSHLLITILFLNATFAFDGLEWLRLWMRRLLIQQNSTTNKIALHCLQVERVQASEMCLYSLLRCITTARYKNRMLRKPKKKL